MFEEPIKPIDVRIYPVGSRVMTKKTGLPTVGCVAGSVVGRVYQSLMVRTPTVPLWDNLYPDWKEKMVLFVTFDKPQKSLSFEEFCDAYPNSSFVGDDELQIKYDKLPQQYMSAYPIDDLEFFEAPTTSAPNENKENAE